MIPLLANAIEAHGGLRRWNAHRRLTAAIVTGGDLWALKGLDQDQDPRTMRIDLHREWASVEPFGKPDQRTEFSPERIAIVTADGRIVAERKNPRASFARHDMRTHWDPLHRAYFNGYALWTYLTTPFLLAMDGFEVRGDSRPGMKAPRFGADCARASRRGLQATAASRISISALTC